MSMSIESSMGGGHARRQRQRRAAVAAEQNTEAARAADSHQGKDAGSLRAYIADSDLARLPPSLVSARVLANTPSLPRRAPAQAHWPPLGSTSPPRLLQVRGELPRGMRNPISAPPLQRLPPVRLRASPVGRGQKE